MTALLPPAAPANPPLDRFGGPEAVVRLVDAFYRAMDGREDARTIRAMHDADLAQTKSVLGRYLIQWLGGPPLYTAGRGAPMLRRRHLRFAIDAAAQEAWMACMRQALAETCADAGLRADLEAAFAQVAAHMRNRDSADTPPPP